MNDWLPVVAGCCIIALALAVVRFAPHSTWAHELRRSYGVRPSGPRGVRTRRDHLRSAGLAATTAIVLMATSMAAGVATDKFPVESTGSWIGLSYSFVALLLSVMAVVMTIVALWKATLWRVELPDTPEHRRALADAIDHLLDGAVSPEERAAFLDVRYVHPQLEQIRRATLTLVKQHRAGVPENFRVQIKAWTSGIRESAG
jgi:hypothetical protein